MQFLQSLLFGSAALIALVSAQGVAFTSVPDSVVAGETYTIEYSGDPNVPAEIILRQGDQNDLDTVETITTATGGSFQWTPTRTGENFALQIVQGESDNYTGLINVTGEGIPIEEDQENEETTSASTSAEVTTTASVTASESASSDASSSEEASETESVTVTSTISASESIITSTTVHSNSTMTTSSTRTGSRRTSSAASETESSAPSQTDNAAADLTGNFALVFGAVVAVAALA